MRDRVEELCDQLLKKLVSGKDNNLVRDLVYPLPAIVNGEMLEVPAEDRDRFKHWSDQISALVFGGLEDPECHARAASGMLEIAEYLSWFIRRTERGPGDNLLSRLTQA